MEQESFKYYAFISYSHKDKKTAKRLQRRLERYHLPSAIQKTYPDLPKSLRPVFIDDSDLVANGTLRTALEANLERSNYLIVVCSPCSAKSEYVNDEVEYFIRRGRADRIIPLIIDGTPHAENPSEECFPSALLSLPRESEILGIDLKKFGERDAFLMVIASMLRLDLDSFVSREAKERKRRAMIFTPIAAALVIVAGILVWNNIRLSSFFSDNSANAQFTIAFAYYCKQDYGQAMEWFKKAAEQGYADAQGIIGDMYYQGLGVEQDYVQALEWFKKAAEQGDIAAQCIIGLMYRDGEGVEQDYAQAMDWFRKAAEQGHAAAQNDIGFLYYQGLGVEQDYVQAMEWFKKAAEQGDAPAQCNIGLMYRDGEGVEQDYAQAMDWFRKAAEQGYADAEAQLEELSRDLQPQN